MERNNSSAFIRGRMARESPVCGPALRVEKAR